MSWVIESEFGKVTDDDVRRMRQELCPLETGDEVLSEVLWELGAFSGGWEEYGQLVTEYNDAKKIAEEIK